MRVGNAGQKPAHREKQREESQEEIPGSITEVPDTRHFQGCPFHILFF